MKHLTKFSILLMLAISFSFMNCTKEGEKGEPGPQGKEGIDGQDGEDGNANVVSQTFNVSSSDWEESGTPGDDMYGYEVTLNVPSITDDIVNNGMVYVYAVIQNNGSNVNFQLPFIYTYNGWTSFFEFAYEKSSVGIMALDDDLYTSQPSDMVFRVVVVEGNAYQSSISDGVDFENYKEVKKYFSLE